MPTSFEVLTDEEFEALRTNGIKVNYWVVCQRKVWLYAKGLRMEPLSDRVALGRLLHERAYPDLPRRELLIDDLIKVDLLEHESKVLEVKHSRKLIDAARLASGLLPALPAMAWRGRTDGRVAFPEGTTQRGSPLDARTGNPSHGSVARHPADRSDAHPARSGLHAHMSRLCLLRTLLGVKENWRKPITSFEMGD